MCEEHPQFNLSVESRICDNCRKQLARTVSTHEENSSDSSTSSIPSPVPVEFDEVERLESLQLVSKCLEDIGETPITKRKARSKKYTRDKVSRITALMDKAAITGEKAGDDREIIEQLKEKFHSTTERSVQVQVLTVLPMSWSIEKIQVEFGASNFMVRKAKQLVKDKGILSSPDPRPGRSLARRTVDIVVAFYESDSSSRMMPGKKDFVSVKGEHGRVHVQKRLVLCNLKELYQDFKQSIQLNVSDFPSLQSLDPNTALLQGLVEHTQYVFACTIHQNVKLMLNGINLQALTSSDDTILTSYHHCLAKMMCNPPLPKCYLGDCNLCPGIEPLRDLLVKILDENLIDSVTFKQWTNVDRSTLETLSMSSDEFIDLLCDKLEALRSHSFIATQQSQYYEECKVHCKKGFVILTIIFFTRVATVDMVLWEDTRIVPRDQLWAIQ